LPGLHSCLLRFDFPKADKMYRLDKIYVHVNTLSVLFLHHNKYNDVLYIFIKFHKIPSRKKPTRNKVFLKYFMKEGIVKRPDSFIL